MLFQLKIRIVIANGVYDGYLFSYLVYAVCSRIVTHQAVGFLVVQMDVLTKNIIYCDLPSD